MGRTYIVAEIGCNHNGDKMIARKMVLEAKNCGVDAVKFQTFKAEDLISIYAPKAEYQKKSTGTEDTQLEMTAKLELPQEDFLELKEYAASLGLGVFSTPFDSGSIDFLESTGQNLWKIPSGEITNLPYLERIASLCCPGKKIILSTGMATIEEIETCINLLTKGGMKPKDITILHCNTEYPTPDKDVNLLAINKLKKHFPEFQIGFSDHSVGYVASIGAAALGVSLVEKHFTLDKDMPGPDHRASATPKELKALVTGIRQLEAMMGNGEKMVTDSERKNKSVARKSIVAKKAIAEGETFTLENLTCKRPGNGISPMQWHQVLGRVAEKAFQPDQLIELSGIENQA